MSAVSPFDHGHRVRQAQKAAAEAGIDVLLVTPGADLRWLVGYDAKPLERLTCLAVPATGEPVLVVPRLELAAAQASGADRHVRVVTHEETDDGFAATARGIAEALGRSPATVAVSDRMWAQAVLRWQSQFSGADLGLAGDVLRPLRLVKSADEVDALRRAGQAIDSVHRRVEEWLRPGRTEREVARDIADAILESGHAEVNFVIVGAGPNSASPHHEPGDRVIQPGDPVVVDIGGAMPDGYCSDCTRTYVAGGDPPPEFTDYYAVLLAAQIAACEAVRPGVSCEQVDAAARDVISAAGFGQAFLHRTGHGIGVDEHEEPWIVAGNRTSVQPGMCFSIEPGIYLAGRHGARIEDIVVCTATGAKRLDTIDRDLAVVG